MNVEISRGTYGVISIKNIDGINYANKSIVCKDISTWDRWYYWTVPFDFINELDCYKRINHPNVLHLYDYNVNGKSYNLTLELGISDLAAQIKDLDQNDKMNIMYQIVTGLLTINNQSILTADLKTKNIIYFEDGRICLCDFGLSQINSCTSKKNIWKSKNLYTIDYRSPEILNEDLDIDIEKSEAWALGIILYEIETNSDLYWPSVDGAIDFWIPENYEKSTSLELYNRIKESLRYQLDSTYERKLHFSKDNDLDHLIENLLQFDPKKRMSIGEAMYHIYFDRIELNKYFLKARPIIYNCEEKILSRQYTPSMYQNINSHWKKIVCDPKQNSSYYRFFKNTFEIIPSIRIFIFAFQLMMIYFEDETDQKYEAGYSNLFYVALILSIKILDKNYLFRNQTLKIIDLISNKMKKSHFKNVMDEFVMRADGKLIYSTPLDLIDYYQKSNRKIYSKIFGLILNGFGYKYDIKTIALYSIGSSDNYSDLPMLKCLENDINNEYFDSVSKFESIVKNSNIIALE